MSYSKYSEEKKTRFLINLGRHVSWAKYLGNLANNTDPYSGDDVGEFFLGPKFIHYSIWMTQAQVLLEAIHKRNIHIPAFDSILAIEERAVVKKFRDYNQHVTNDIADTKFLDFLEHPEVAINVQKAVDLIDQWVQSQPETHKLHQSIWKNQQGED